MKGLLIESVIPGSIAEEFEIEAGDLLLAINGNKLRDIIDYNYFSCDDELTLEFEKKGGEIWEIEVERGESEPLGLTFQAPTPAECGNNCIFCFVHQLPKGLRRSLYIKDEDYRLSFLHGNYVTLSNIAGSDIERIKAQKLSPLYISVHATIPAIREKMLGKTGIPPILEIINELAKAGITMHTQVVLCPGINDGLMLEQTVADLSALFPSVASLAIVPVGLTGHRKGLPTLQQVTKEYTAKLLSIWQSQASALAKRLGKPFLFFADEFYIKAETAFPPLKEYGNLPQIENGVGMIPLFLKEAGKVIRKAKRLKPVSVTTVTGEFSYPYLENFLHRLAEKTGINFTVIPIKNRLFGGEVTVTGLVSGGDILDSLRKVKPGDVILIPDVMLKEGEEVFLDDFSISDLKDALGREVVIVESTPLGIYNAITELSNV